MTELALVRGGCGRAGRHVRQPVRRHGPGARRPARRRRTARRRLPRRCCRSPRIASFEAIGPLAGAFQLLDANEAAARRLFELIDAAPAVVDRAAPGPSPIPADHAIEFRDLRFRYAPDEPWVLDGCSCPGVPAGQPRHRRAERLGQVDAGQPAAAVLGLRRGRDPGRRPRHPRVPRGRRSGGCSASCPRTSTCSTRRSATTWRSRTPT